MKAAVLALLVWAATAPVPASAQPAADEDDLELVARSLALRTVQSFYLRWPPSQFPLRVAFAAGENLRRTTACTDRWLRQYEEYVQFINAKRPLLTRTPIGKALDAYVFFGSDSEHEVLPAYRLEETWFQKPGISIQWRIQDRVSRSYQFGYGVDNFIQFASEFEELSDPSCDGFDPSDYLGSTLLPGYNALIVAMASRLFEDKVAPTLVWRAQRRLLSAMKRLPDEDQPDLRRLRSDLIELLSNE